MEATLYINLPISTWDTSFQGTLLCAYETLHWTEAPLYSSELQSKEIWQSIHPRNFGNRVTVLSTVHLSAPKGTNVKTFYAVWEHATCYGISMLLTAVKTGYSLTSITWPHFGLRCRPIEVASFFFFFFLVLRWQVRSFQLIAGPILIGSLSNGYKDIWLK